MAIIKDDWEKPRNNGNHLKAEEIEKIKVAFNCGRTPSDIARELKCSTRVASKYYSKFRGAGPYRKIKPKAPAELTNWPKLQPKPTSRFYKGNFEL